MLSKGFKNIIHKIFVGMMAVWISGIVLLLCCHAKDVGAMESCPLAEFGVHCDKAEKEKNAQKITNHSKDDGMDCCAFIPAFFDKTRSLDYSPQFAVGAPVTTLLKVRALKIQLSYSPVYPSYVSAVLSKNSAFLKNHAIRI